MRKKDKKDTDMLEAALEVFSRKGLAAATYDDVAKASGINRLTIIRRYPDEMDLFQAVLEHCLAEFQLEILEGLDKGFVPPEEALPPVLVECFRKLFQRIHLVRLIQNESVRGGTDLLSTCPFYQSLQKQLFQILSQYGRGIAQEHLEQSADVLLSSVWSLVLEWNLKHGLWKPNEQALNDALERSRRWLGILGIL